MRLSLTLCLCLLFSCAAVHAESKNPADYPLRIHIFGHSQTTFYRWREAEESKGEGRANLFANGEARGVDFNFDCSEKLKSSFSFETYPAKWKKQDRELVVLLPVFGRSNTYFTCNIKTDVKDFAYASHDGRLSSEPVADFKAWMVRHDYDPEHGENTPIKLQPKAVSAGESGESQ
jgi:hypothetical protein